MSLFPLLLAGHLVGDWIVQTDWQAANKMSSWKANQQHMVGYHAVVVAGAAAAGLPALECLLVVAVSWASHSVIDRRWPVIWLMEHTGSRPFSKTWGVIAVDQALHLSILAVLSALLA